MTAPSAGVIAWRFSSRNRRSSASESVSRESIEAPSSRLQLPSFFICVAPSSWTR